MAQREVNKLQNQPVSHLTSRLRNEGHSTRNRCMWAVPQRLPTVDLPKIIVVRSTSYFEGGHLMTKSGGGLIVLMGIRHVDHCPKIEWTLNATERDAE